MGEETEGKRGRRALDFVERFEGLFPAAHARLRRAPDESPAALAVALPAEQDHKDTLAPRKPDKPLESLVSDERIQGNPNKSKARNMPLRRVEPTKARRANDFQTPLTVSPTNDRCAPAAGNRTVPSQCGEGARGLGPPRPRQYR